ncbi:MAG: PAS domain S-box protein [Rhodospirillales bacterium]
MKVELDPVDLDRSAQQSASGRDGPPPAEAATLPHPVGAADEARPPATPIRVVLLRLVLGVLAPLLVVVAGFGIWNVDLQRETVRRNLLDAVGSLSLNVDRDIEAVQASLRTLALAQSLQEGDFAAFQNQAVEAARPFDGWIVLADRSLQQIVNSRVPYGSPLPTIQVPEQSRHMFATGTPSVSGLFIGNVSKAPLVAVSVPAFVNGQIAYDLRIGFVPERFAPLLGAPPGWQAFLFDQEHKLITRSDYVTHPDHGGARLGNQIGALLPADGGAESGTVINVTFPSPGIDAAYVVAYQRSPVSGWTVAVAAPVSIVNQRVIVAALVFAGGAMLSLLLAIVAALILGRRIASPLQQLAGQAEDLLAGQSIPNEPLSLYEIADVRRALIKAGQIHRRHFQTQLELDRETRARELAEYSRKEIEKREKKARRLIDSNLIGIVIADRQRVLEANDVFLALIGYTRAELDQGAVDWRAITPAEHPPLGDRAVKWLQEGDEIAPFEKKFVRKDGSRVSVLVGAARIDSETPDLNWVCFALDLTAQKQAAAELKRSEERYRGLAEAIASVVWIAAPSGDILEMQHWSELTGQSRDQFRGYGWLDVLHLDDRETTRAGWVQAIDNGQPLDLEYRVRNRNGRYRWYHARGTPVVDDDGSIREWIGICIDVDERKSAAARQLLLMAELDHRVRNILAAIQSMVSLTGAGVDSKEEYAALLKGRIGAMARTHGLLSRQTWQGATLMEIVNDEITPFTAGPDSIVIEGDPDFTLRPKDALDFALVIHELMTNAAKYGALSVATGRVSISWGVNPRNGMLVFTWRETGGPPPRKLNRRGFGSRLIANVFSPTVGRSAECDYLAGGLSCTLRMPSRPFPNLQHPQRDPETDPAASLAMPDGRILIVEDEPLIAMDLHRIVSQTGLDVSGPVGTLDRALDLAEDQTLTGAIVDVNLGPEASYPVADRLRRSGIPIIFITGYAAETLPGRFAGETVLQKPVEPPVLLAALRRALSRGAQGSGDIPEGRDITIGREPHPG